MAADPQDPDVNYVPLKGTRAQSVQRLQVGFAGLAAMVLLVGLANIIMERAKQTDASAVPEAAGASSGAQAAAVNDPLADAGVAPDVTIEPKPRATVVDPRRIPDPPKN